MPRSYLLLINTNTINVGHFRSLYVCACVSSTSSSSYFVFIRMQCNQNKITKHEKFRALDDLLYFLSAIISRNKNSTKSKIRHTDWRNWWKLVRSFWCVCIVLAPCVCFSSRVWTFFLSAIHSFHFCFVFFLYCVFHAVCCWFIKCLECTCSTL